MTWTANISMVLGELALDVKLAGAGGVTALIGENGAGKSTILRVLCGGYRPQRGRIVIGERVVFDADENIDVAPEARRIGYLPQGRSLIEHLSAVDNVALSAVGTALWKTPQAARGEANALLEQMGCADLGPRLAKQLSGGEAQKIALARAFLSKPDMMLLDEPLTGLDASARPHLRAFLGDQLRARQCPAVLVTHDVRDVRALAGQVAVVKAGRVVLCGTAEEVARAPRNDFITEMFGN